MLGGYSGSNSFAQKRLSIVPEAEFRNAWVLTENSSRAISIDVLNIIQKSLDSDYTPVATFTVPGGYGGRKSDSIQTLYRPKIK